MKLTELRDKSVLILGLGLEGRSTWRFLRAAFPEKLLGIADQLTPEKLPSDVAREIGQDSRLRLHLGDRYMAAFADYDVVVKAPGISVMLPGYRQALAAGKEVTSQTALFFANFPGTILGVTGTKGKSTTASLLHAILKRSNPDTLLVGNVGVPPLDTLARSGATTQAMYELSSHQLEGLRQSPPIAVLLNIVPEHLDYYRNFEAYVAAKENISRFQGGGDTLIYDADHALPREIAARSRAQQIACSISGEPPRVAPACFIHGDSIVYRTAAGAEERLVCINDVRLPGRFNLINVAAAAAAARVAGVPAAEIAEAVRNFQPLEHRLERVGTRHGVTYYNDSIATIPEAVIAALDTLGADVETLLLGGADRGLDFSGLAKRLLGSDVKNVILLPPSGERIWKAVCDEGGSSSVLPKNFFAASMEEAVELAKRHTSRGKICLLSPASPSFGLFHDYRERGESFRRLVMER